MNKDYVPKTLEEAYEWFDVNVPDVDEFIASDEKKVIGLSHHGLGMWIRNNWGLWETNSALSFWFISLGIKHADDMSGIILTSYWRHKNSKPIELENQIQHYKDWWKEHGDQFPKEDKGIG